MEDKTSDHKERIEQAMFSPFIGGYWKWPRGEGGDQDVLERSVQHLESTKSKEVVTNPEYVRPIIAALCNELAEARRQVADLQQQLGWASEAHLNLPSRPKGR